jgi:hypothetical protein
MSARDPNALNTKKEKIDETMLKRRWVWMLESDVAAARGAFFGQVGVPVHHFRQSIKLYIVEIKAI